MSSTPFTNTSTTTSRTTFLDLPPEIRNTVYYLSLHDDEPIELHYLAESKNVRMSSSPDTDFPFSIPSINLLRASRQIHSEATPILYGSNAFSAIHDLRALNAFLGMIGDSRTLLRYVRTADDLTNRTLLKSTISRLKHAKGLQRLELGWTMWTKMSAKVAAAQCRVFVQALKKSRRCTAEEVVEVVEVDVPVYRPWTHNMPVGLAESWSKRAKEYQEEMRAELRKSLE